MMTLTKIGQYTGGVSPAFNTPNVIEQLANIQTLINSENAKRISFGPDYVIRGQLPLTSGVIDVAIKVFKRQSWMKDRYDFKHKSKAARSFSAGRHLEDHGISTPASIAWLDRWEGKRLVESYYLCKYEQATCFRDELVRIYRDVRDNDALIALFQQVAPAIKAMHDIGFMHGDLGNQNILLPKNDQGEWLAPCFIDLNRCKYSEKPLTHKERAFDISRLIIPGDYLRIFKWIYFNNEKIPADFDKYELSYRLSFERHRKSRKYRHPLRYLKNRHKVSKKIYPPARDLWLWDEKSAQPMICLSKREKNKQRSLKQAWQQTIRTLCLLPRIYGEYRKIIQKSFTQRRSMHNRIGIALHPKETHIDAELKLLAQLGNPPVLIRFCHHETPEDWQLGLSLAERLHAQHTPFMVALLQDRQALLQPQRWEMFLETIISALANSAQHFEITHALNRVKWGIWTSEEFATLMKPAFSLQKRYPHIKFVGPAGIDFEYHPVINALSELKGQRPLAALSHLLYVDRRGAPENKQGLFSTVEKSALLKAVARAHPQCNDHVIISEVNWPLKDGGIWSPIMCPYLRPNWKTKPIGETESDYADYMLRYLALTICSGHVEQVYWWRLSAHGYGLVDDLDNFRPRPAFTALAFFLQLLGKAEFIQRKKSSNDEDYWLEFQGLDQRITMAWTSASVNTSLITTDYDVAYDRDGITITPSTLTGTPIYLIKHQLNPTKQ